MLFLSHLVSLHNFKESTYSAFFPPFLFAPSGSYRYLGCWQVYRDPLYLPVLELAFHLLLGLFFSVSGQVCIQSNSSRSFLLLCSGIWVALMTPQKFIRCSGVMISLSQGHSLLVPSVSWYGQAAVDLRYSRSLNSPLVVPLRCSWLALALPLYLMFFPLI